MPRATYTSEAERDLGQITKYIAQDNLLAAMAWLDKTRATCNLLAIQPAIGQRINTKRFGDVRRHVVGNYRIYYEPTPEGIDVVRVVHAARDQGKLV
jgi:toxin ParE1/3/4